MGPNYSFEYVYDTYEDADDARNCLFKEVGRYEFLSLNDVNDILDKDAPFMDPEVGWTEELIMESRVEKRPLGYSLWLPKPININITKEDKTMANYNTYGKIEVIKSQEEIELEEKIAKREEYKAANEKKERDVKAKELHDKYQSLIDAGFSTEQAYDILQTKMKMDEF